MSFPELKLSQWQPTRDTLQGYTKIVGRVRRELASPQKHWWHISLRTSAVGLTTTPIPYKHGIFDIEFNFFTHEVTVRTSKGDLDMITLEAQSAKDFGEELLEILDSFGIEVSIPAELRADENEGTYEDAAVEAYWSALLQIDQIFTRFKSHLRRETSPTQLWPHHFDFAMLWLSGRRVPGQEPADPEQSDEQMNFGFSTGDSTITEPYFYATAYPLPDGLTDTPLPAPAYWHTAGFTGAILPYSALTTADDPEQLLLTYLRTAQKAGATRMKG